MGFKYTRVRDTHTGHEYDVLSHKVDPAKHEPVDDPERWPETNRPRPARHNVKGPRPTARSTSDVGEGTDPGAPAGEAEKPDDEAASVANPEGTAPPKKPSGRRAPRAARTDQSSSD